MIQLDDEVSEQRVHAAFISFNRYEGSTAIVTLAQACYAFEGDLKGVMRLTLGGKTVTLSVLTLMVRKVLTDAIIDPGNVIPSLEDLLAQIEAMETATAAANTAAGAANTAAAAADSATSAANTAATAATNAANAANSGEIARVAAEKNRASAETARANAETARAKSRSAIPFSRPTNVCGKGRFSSPRSKCFSQKATKKECAEPKLLCALRGMVFAFRSRVGRLFFLSRVLRIVRAGQDALQRGIAAVGGQRYHCAVQHGERGALGAERAGKPRGEDQYAARQQPAKKLGRDAADARQALGQLRQQYHRCQRACKGSTLPSATLSLLPRPISAMLGKNSLSRVV